MKKKSKRRYTRVPYTGKVDLIFDDQEYRECDLENLCLSGMWVQTPHRQDEGDRCEVIIHGIGATNNRVLKLTGEVVRTDDEGVAILFTDMNFRSYTNLQTIILNHADDPFVVAEEFIDELPADQ